jgi:hypothetical protein
MVATAEVDVTRAAFVPLPNAPARPAERIA